MGNGLGRILCDMADNNDDYQDYFNTMVAPHLENPVKNEIKCECGAEIAKTTHQRYCPKYKKTKE